MTCQQVGRRDPVISASTIEIASPNPKKSLLLRVFYWMDFCCDKPSTALVETILGLSVIFVLKYATHLKAVVSHL